MARAAAIVDVDRTLLTGRPGWTLLDDLHRAGVAVPPGPLGPAVDAAATASLSSQLSMLAVQAGRGWPDAAVREAATMAAEMVVDVRALPPPAARHPPLRRRATPRRQRGAAGDRRAARAELLGAEDVVGTTWAEGRGFLGPIQGPLVWARSKADGGAAWLRSAGVSARRRSAATPTTSSPDRCSPAVGHATAVDPDARLTVLARTRGWTIRYLDVPEGVVKLAGRELQEWLRPFAGMDGVLNARIEITGLEHVPGRGGAILAFNHRSYFDAAVVSQVAARAGRAVRGLGKKEVLDAPVRRPVRSGGGDDPGRPGHRLRRAPRSRGPGAASR